MKVLLVPSPVFKEGKISHYVPVGLLSLQATISSYFGDIVKIFNFPLDKHWDDLSRFINDISTEITSLNANIVGFSVLGNAFHISLEIAQIVKKQSPQTIIIFGGPHVFGIEDRLLTFFPFVDAVFRGESEHSLQMFIQQKIEKTADIIPGIWQKGQKFKPSSHCNIDTLPSLDIAPQWNDLIKRVTPMPDVPIEIARGCKGSCAFCSTQRFWGKPVRIKSPKVIVEHAKRAVNKNCSAKLALVGDNAFVSKRTFTDISKSLRRIKNQPFWSASVRLFDMDYSDIDMLRYGGCGAIFVGVESASTKSLSKIGKNYDHDLLIENIQYAIYKGISVTTSLIIGFPWETEDDVKKTYSLHCDFLKMNVTKSQVHVLAPFPNTLLSKRYETEMTSSFSDAVENDIKNDTVDRSPFSNIIINNYDLFPPFSIFKTPKLSNLFLRAVADAAERSLAIYSSKKGGNRNDI